MPDPASNDTAQTRDDAQIVREARERAQAVLDGEFYNDTMAQAAAAPMRALAQDVVNLADRLAASAEKADEWERKAKSRLAASAEQERLRLEAEAALLTAQQERDALVVELKGVSEVNEALTARADRAEQDNTRLEAALDYIEEALGDVRLDELPKRTQQRVSEAWAAAREKSAQPSLIPAALADTEQGNSVTRHAWLKVMLQIHKANPRYHLPPPPWTRRTAS